MELSVDASVAVDIASKDDLERHHKWIRDRLVRPEARYRVLRAGVAVGAGPLLIDYGQAPAGHVYAPQWVAVFADTPFGGSGTSSNVASVYGTVTAPVAGGQIAATPTLPAGTYQVVANAWYGATADVADNMQVEIQGVATITRLEVPTSINGPSIPQTMQVVLLAPGVIRITAIAGGAVGSVYKARLDVTPIAAPIASVTAAVFVGVPRGTGGSNVSYSIDDVVMPGLPVPQATSVPDKVICRGGQHIFVVLAGTGLAAGTTVGYNANVGVILADDDPSVYAWI